jgi:nucleotide-binding universal stress UspA family protein
VELLTADVPSLISSVRSPAPNLVDEINTIARNRTENAVAVARQAFHTSGIQVSGATPMGDPRAVILNEASEWNADLIILGSRGRHGLAHLTMGSVAESVAAYAKCSVEVVR